MDEHFAACPITLSTTDEGITAAADGIEPLAGAFDVVAHRSHLACEEYRALWKSSIDARVLALESDLDHFVSAEHTSVDAMVEMQRAMSQERVQRIEEAVVNVRKAELLLHRNRIARHCRGLDTELEKENERFKITQAEVKSRSTHFVKMLEVQSDKLVTMGNVTLLQALRERCATTAEDFRTEIRKFLQRYRQSVDNALGGIREANAVLRSSFKTFSEGGNFSSFEITTYTEVLSALESRIDEAETMIVDVLNNLEGEQVIVAENMMQNCDDRLKILLRDVRLHESSHERIRSMQVEFKSLIGECNAQSSSLDTEMAALRDLEMGVPVEIVFDTMRNLTSLVEARAQLLGALKPTADEAAEQAAKLAEEEGLAETPTPKAEKPQEKPKRGGAKQRKTIFIPKTPPTLQIWVVENKGTFMVSVNELRVRCVNTPRWYRLVYPHCVSLTHQCGKLGQVPHEHC
jgi:hypothetical protein